MNARFQRLVACLLLAAMVAAGEPELTFFVVSDTHYGLTAEGDRTLPRLVEAMNGLPGTAYPDPLGGTVGTPRGVIHAGDATDNGKPEPWRSFVRDFGLDGRDGLLRFPVIETFGNHDGGPDSVVRNAIRDRNRRRTGFDLLSANGLFSTWTWEGIRFVMLGISPGTTTRPYDPENSIAFLDEVLAKDTAGGPPTFIIHHFGFDKDHSLRWWPDAWRDAYAAKLAGRNIAGIIHGHAHKPFIDQWQGWDVYHPPHFRHAGPRNTGSVSHGFFVFRIAGDALSVAERRIDGTWGMTATKTLKR